MNVTLPPLHPAQRLVAACSARFRVVIAGRRWRKTSLGVLLSLRAAHEQRARCVWVSPSHKQSDVAWKAFRELAVHLPGTRVRESDRTVTLASGGDFVARSSEREDLLRGIGADFLVQDEADFQDGAVWDTILRPMLADRQGRAVFISTPNREGGWLHRLFELGRMGTDPEWVSFHFPSWTNPHLPAGEIEAARASMSTLAFRREFGAEFVSAAGARVRREWIQYGTPPTGAPVSMGVDLAISERASADWTCVVTIAQPHDGAAFVLDAQRIRASFHEVQEFIKSLASKWNPGVVAIEDVAFQRGTVQELLRTTKLNVRGVRPVGDKVSRFAPLEARYEQGLIRHVHGLPMWFEDELLSFPVGEHDDAVDALGLAWAGGDLGDFARKFMAAMATV